jgi:hypothetical protein
MVLSTAHLEVARIVVAGCIVLANVAVWVGVSLENEKYPKRVQERGWRMLVRALAAEAMLAVLLLVVDTIINVQQERDIASARMEAANTGVKLGTLETEMQGRIKQIEDEPARIGAAKPPPLSTTPVPPGPPTTALATGFHVSGEARQIIRSTTLPGAIISIIPFMPGEIQRFADDLGAAFSAVPGVQVAVGRGNIIMNGQTGLIVQYDHSNPVSASVFNALAKAGFHPLDGPSTPATSVVFIKVASQ